MNDRNHHQKPFARTVQITNGMPMDQLRHQLITNVKINVVIGSNGSPLNPLASIAPLVPLSPLDRQWIAIIADGSP
jgi:hypothetical protein